MENILDPDTVTGFLASYRTQYDSLETVPVIGAHVHIQEPPYRQRCKQKYDKVKDFSKIFIKTPLFYGFVVHNCGLPSALSFIFYSDLMPSGHLGWRRQGVVRKGPDLLNGGGH